MRRRLLRLKELRERKGWSQTELARRAGLQNTVVNRAERGQNSITLKTLEKLAKAFGVGPRTLLSR